MKRAINILIPLFAGLLIFVIYTFIHEGAHAILVIIFGGTLTEFDVNILNGYPHISWAGELTTFKSAIINIAGPLLPVVLWFGGLLLINRNSNLLIQKVYFYTSIGVLGTLIPNIIIPILLEVGVDVRNEDIAKFVNNIKLNGFVVSIILAIIFVVGIVLMIKRLNIKAALLYQVDISLKCKKHLFWAVASSIILSVILITASINIMSKSINASNVNTPSKYDYLVNVDLKNISTSESQIYEFNLEKAMIYDFRIVGNTKERVMVRLISSQRVNGLRANEMEICSGKGTLNSNYSNWLLEKGNYKIYLTKDGDIGNLKIYMNERSPIDFELSQMYEEIKILNGEIPKLEEGFKLVSKQGLSDYSNKVIYELSTDQDVNLSFSIYLTTQDGRATVQLVGDDYNEDLISEYQIRTEGRGVSLKRGKYKVIVSCSDCDGDIYLFLKAN